MTKKQSNLIDGLDDALDHLGYGYDYIMDRIPIQDQQILSAHLLSCGETIKGLKEEVMLDE